MRDFSDVKDVFDLFDFWDGRDGLVDGAKVGDLLRCTGLNPTVKIILGHGGTKKLGMSVCELQLYRCMQCDNQLVRVAWQPGSAYTSIDRFKSPLPHPVHHTPVR